MTNFFLPPIKNDEYEPHIKKLGVFSLRDMQWFHITPDEYEEYTGKKLMYEFNTKNFLIGSTLWFFGFLSLSILVFNLAGA